MKKIISWKVTSVFGNDINTDDIIRADILQESTDKDFFAQYAFEKYDKEFINRCKQSESNVIIAWENFGCGSSREHAAYALSYNNVSIVIAKSFPDIFYRNSINNWLILVKFDEIEKFKMWDEIKIDLDNKKIILTSPQPSPLQERELEFSFEAPEEDIFIMKNWGQLWVVKNYIENKEINIIPLSQPFPPREKGAIWQTIVEKIISNHVWKKVFAWDKVSALPIDLIYQNEVIAPASIVYFWQDFWKEAKVFDPEKIFFIPDHTIPSSSIQVSIWIDMMKKFAKKHSIKMFKQGRWIEHIVWIEEGYILPWKIVLWTDSHTCTNWAMNCFAIWVGTTDAEYAMASWALFNVEVPETIKVVLTWKLQKWVSAKDIVLEMLKKLWAWGASKKVLEIHWDAIKDMKMDARTTIANMAVEMSARTAIFAPDEEVIKNIKNPKYDYEFIYPDQNAKYSDILEIDLSKLEPNIAFPHKPANVCKVTEIDNQIKKSAEINSIDFPAITKEDTKINECFLWACTNWKYEDLKIAAQILKWRKIHEDVTFVVVPASDKIYKRCLKEWIIETFVEAWCLVESPNCAKCFWKHMWVAWPEARIMSTSNRNYKWRMWSADALIFLASPASVAAAAIAWEIVDPREYL